MAAVSVIVPTLFRTEHLRKCLASIGRQTGRNMDREMEVLVGIRSDDSESRDLLVANDWGFPVRGVTAEGVGVVGSMSSCLRQATGDLIALLDDDIELPPDWLERMKSHLEQHSRAVGSSGRDLLMDHPAMRQAEPRVLDVGRIHWMGRITGNHHRGGGEPRSVDVFRGSNVLFRGSFLRKAGFEAALRGKGAQVNWELALALRARAKGFHFFFDPTVQVIHHVAPRQDEDSVHRGKFAAEATSDIAFNETIVVARHASGWTRVSVLAWQVLVGSAVCPGFLHLLRQIYLHDSYWVARLRATIRGRAQIFLEC